MKTWAQDDRERAYTRLCEAVTAVGRDRESLFLARLTLLLAEQLADADLFANLVTEAAAVAPAPRQP